MIVCAPIRATLPEQAVLLSRKGGTEDMTTPTIEEFRAVLLRRLKRAEMNGETYRDVRAGDLHREVGECLDADHRMPTCCEAMRQTMRGSDRILAVPAIKDGANLIVRYALPRASP